MRPLSLTLPLLLLLAVGCQRPLPIHPEAMRNNELCAQRLTDGNLDSAESFCDHALEFSPQYAEAWVNRGLILLARGRNTQAKEAFIKAVRLNQELAQAYNDLGILALDEHQYGEAEDRFRRALKVNPDYAEARYNLALDYWAWRKPDRAKKELRSLINTHPNLADPFHFLGILRLEDRATEEAISLFKQAIQLNPRNPSYWVALGVAYARVLRYEDAEYAFQSCLDADSKDEVCQQNLELVRARSDLPTPALSPPKP